MLRLVPVVSFKGAAEAVPAGSVTVPLKLGEARFAFKSSAVCCAVETGLPASLVLLTFPKPTIDAVMPVTLPVKLGDARFAFNPSLSLSLLIAVRIVSSAVIVPFAEL